MCLLSVGKTTIMKNKNKQLDYIWKEVYESNLISSISTLSMMCEEPSSDVRLKALIHIRRNIESFGIKDEFFNLALNSIEDSNNNCRWQSLIIIGEFIQTKPEMVWMVVDKYGESPDADMRTAIATVLLEHLLEYHNNKYKKIVEEKVKSSKLFSDTYSMIWDFNKNG